MKPLSYTLLVLSALLWLEHWCAGFSYEVSVLHNGNCVCSLFTIKAACALLGMAACLIAWQRRRQLQTIALTAVFAMSLAMDIAVRSAACGKDDDHSPKATIFLPGGFTLEERHGS